MKVYVSPHEQMILCTAAGVHRFAGGQYIAKSKREIREIEKSKDFGKRFFALEVEDVLVDTGEEVEVAAEEEKETEEYVCEICGASFPVKIALIGHMRSHEPKKDKR